MNQNKFGKLRGIMECWKIETHLRPMTIYLSHLPSGGVDRRWAGCETGHLSLSKVWEYWNDG
ncbi:MAG: hypothetical protein H8E85_07195 [Candidatus Marinimicrobia bacterium]|nr:hypothetical protein [Candidatus Neomarinimicrobiota bacterium]